MNILRIAKKLGTSFKRFVKHYHYLDRETVASIYLRGDGIEVGALHNPILVPRTARVRYVDRLSNEDLKKNYGLESENLVSIDIVDDGQTLSTIAAGSLDFVIANHFIEHCENPILAIQNFLRVLKHNGILYLAIPDKRFTFDKDRSITPLSHVLKDFEVGPATSKHEHVYEWLTNFEKCTPNEADKKASEAMDQYWDIHYHVWTQGELLEMFSKLRERLHFDVELFLKMENECIFVLQKQ